MVSLSQTPMWRIWFGTKTYVTPDTNLAPIKSFLAMACGVASHVQRKSSGGPTLGVCPFIIHVIATDVIQLLGGFADSKCSGLYENARIIKLWTVKGIRKLLKSKELNGHDIHE